MKSYSILLTVGVVVVFSAGLGFNWQEENEKKETQQNSKEAAQVEGSAQESGESIDDQFVAIDNMHHFMEYIQQPSYRSLKEGLAADPGGRRAWRPLKSHALILAETTAIVARRVPEGATEEQTKLWKQISLDVYNSGKELYGSMGDYEKAKENYGLMIDNCNRCHQEFENGKHQLTK